jgi:hypothetical protein
MMTAGNIDISNLNQGNLVAQMGNLNGLGNIGQNTHGLSGHPQNQNQNLQSVNSQMLYMYPGQMLNPGQNFQGNLDENDLLT